MTAKLDAFYKNLSAQLDELDQLDVEITKKMAEPGGLSDGEKQALGALISQMDKFLDELPPQWRPRV